MKDKIHIFTDKMEKDANIFSRQTDLQMNEFYSFRPCDYYLVAARILEESDREKRQLEL